MDGGNEGDGEKVRTFCIDRKALPAAEQFLLSRYALHEQVYFHKTTRCVESMISALLNFVSRCASDRKNVRRRTGLDADHPIIRFFAHADPTVAEYLALDDVVLLGAIERLMYAQDEPIAILAKRLRDRDLYKTLDCSTFSRDLDRQLAGAKKIDKHFDLTSGHVIKDTNARLNIYTQVGGDEEKAHKKLRILEDDGKTPEITKFDGIVNKLTELKLTRYYFANPQDREKARTLGARQ